VDNANQATIAVERQAANKRLAPIEAPTETPMDNANQATIAVERQAAASAGSTTGDFIQLTKPRITLMVVLTTAVGFALAAPTPVAWLLLLHTVIGTALVASGASALNMVIERSSDARMRRTARRPLPAGRLRTVPALLFGLALSAAGMLYLLLLVNGLTAALGAFTLLGYVLVYTPMKRMSSIATIVGAVPGAVPPMMGVSAASGSIDALAWALFGILFLWQMPHFLAIAWMYKSDYQRGGFPMLSVRDPRGVRTARQMVLYAAALLPVSLLPSALGSVGAVYAIGAVLAGVVFLAYSWAFAYEVSLRAARRVLLTSVLYLPAVLGLLLFDRALRFGG